MKIPKSDCGFVEIVDIFNNQCVVSPQLSIHKWKMWKTLGMIMLRDSYKCHVDIVDDKYYCKTLKKRCFHKSTKSTCLSIAVALGE
jgi:hypothetical protein